MTKIRKYLQTVGSTKEEELEGNARSARTPSWTPAKTSAEPAIILLETLIEGSTPESLGCVEEEAPHFSKFLRNAYNSFFQTAVLLS